MKDHLPRQALPGKQVVITGTVEKKPTGNRAAGICGRWGKWSATSKIPGAPAHPWHITSTPPSASGVVDSALTIPKETLRHDPTGDYAASLEGRTPSSSTPVKTGISSARCASR